MKTHSALARPLDRRYPTNLAVLILAPVAGAVLGGIALLLGQSVGGALEAAFRGGLTAFAGWALAREIAPDDNPAAFVSMGLALITLYLVPESSVLLVFTTIMLTRIVNRSVGVPATLFDSAAVTLLTAWTVYSTRNGLPAVVAAIAFGLDGSLSAPLRRQWIFTGICLAGGLGLLASMPPAMPAREAGIIAALPIVTIALLYVLLFLRTRQVRSVGDQTAEPLVLSRVRAGMAIAWLMAVQGPLVSDAALAQSSLLWAVLAGLIVMVLFRLTMPNGANDLRPGKP